MTTYKFDMYLAIVLCFGKPSNAEDNATERYQFIGRIRDITVRDV